MNKTLTSTAIISAVVMIIVSGCHCAFTYTKCDASLLKANVNWVNVSNCDPTLVNRCSFKKGTNVTITTSFTSHEPTTGLKVKIYGSVLGVYVPWRVNPDDACAYGIVCPIGNNTENVFALSMPISTSFPNIGVNVKLRLEDSAKRPHFCIQFPAKIDP